jgi:hypothetical protein
LLTVHHWSDPRRGLLELSRVADRVVIFTFDPGIHNSFWLFRDYVPAITELDSTARVIGVDPTAELVGADRIEPILIRTTVSTGSVGPTGAAPALISTRTYDAASRASGWLIPPMSRQASNDFARISRPGYGMTATATCSIKM